MDKSKTHEVDLKDWEYSYFDIMQKKDRDAFIFLEDPSKEKYDLMDVIKINNIETGESQSRLITGTTIRNKGLADGYVILQLGKVADFDGCIIGAIMSSVGKI